MTDKTPTYDDWKAKADKEVKGRDLTWHTPEGIDAPSARAMPPPEIEMMQR